ncbi:MAG: hypothetical protein JWP32_288 [Schumannella sp.]|nr:hypothetical protein [Schumannella sp.]
MASSNPAQREAFDRVVRFQQNRFGRGAPLRDDFFVSARQEGTHHPLASLMNARSGSGGGRGGKTRVLLYLSLLWVAGGGDHTTSRPSWFWADLLGLPDSKGAGGRAIRSNWEELERRKFVGIEPGKASGDLPTIRALKEDGSGDAYVIPTGQPGDTYRRVPEAAWRTLFHTTDLTGAGLSMYLVSLRTFGQAGGNPLTFPRSYFSSEYGMSESTRKAGLRNLVDLGVLEAEGISVETGAGVRRRGRTNYSLLPVYEPPAPATPAPTPPRQDPPA